MSEMKQGQVLCGCGNEYWFISPWPEVICMKCGKLNPNLGEPIPEPEPEVTEDGTNI